MHNVLSYFKNFSIRYFNFILLLQNTLVSTAETARLFFFLDVFVQERVPIMLIGAAGSGKSVIMAEKLAALPDTYNIANVPLNYYTTSGNKYLQKIISF